MVTERSTGSRVGSMRINFNSYLNEFGTTISLIKKTDTYDSMGRLTGQTETTSTISADIQWITKDDLSENNIGEVKIGDGMIYVKYNADISLEDEFSFNSRRWRIVTQVEGEVIGGDVMYKAYLIRANDQ